MNFKKQIMAVLLGTMIITASESAVGTSPVITAEAHSGRTDANGGHKDNKNKSGLGSYHYHCGGNPAHLHTNGICPYSSNAAAPAPTAAPSSSAPSAELPAETSSALDPAVIVSVQEKLNEKGYNCGIADGIAGQKTREALENFQRDNNLTIDGNISEEVLKALGLLSEQEQDTTLNSQ